MNRRTSRRPRDRARKSLEQLPYGVFKHRFAAIEVLGDEALESIHDASMTILETCGLRVMDAEARGIFRRGGFDVDDSTERV
ncbi:MAG: trimethylamine methyltransferase family protein, partial [Acidiferrobacterales bacterium]